MDGFSTHAANAVLQEGQAAEQGTVAASASVVFMSAAKNRICISCGNVRSL